MSRVFCLASLAATLVATPLVAQSIPSVTRSKAAAMNATNATNAHTRAMTPDSLVVEQDTARKAPPVQKRMPATVRRAPAQDSAGGSTAVGNLPPNAPDTFRREVYSYDKTGRRDPFLSLMSSAELRPLVSDLKLVTVLHDPTGRNSVAILRDLGTKEQYRVKVGQTLGRMRVARIEAKSVVFTIEEFGFSRQEELSLGDPTQARKR
jgi:hypothetical protein